MEIQALDSKVLHYAPPAAQLPPELARARLVRPGQAATMLGVSVATVYRMARAGRLSRPRRLSHRVAGWPLAEIERLLSGEPTDAG